MLKIDEISFKEIPVRVVKPGRPAKYTTDEERAAARRASSAKSQRKIRERAGVETGGRPGPKRKYATDEERRIAYAAKQAEKRAELGLIKYARTVTRAEQERLDGLLHMMREVD